MSDIKTNLNLEDLDTILEKVIDEVVPHQREVEDKEGHWYSMRVRPYKTVDNRIEGAVLVFIDMSDIKQAVAEVNLYRDFTSGMMDVVQTPIVILDTNLTIHRANQAFHQFFETSQRETTGTAFPSSGAQVTFPGLQGLFREVIQKNATIENYEVLFDFPRIGKRKILLNARRVEMEPGKPKFIIIAIEEVGKPKREEGETA